MDMSWFGEFVQNAIFTVFFGILPKDTRIFAKTAFPAVANSECWNAIICQGPSLCPENPQTGIIRTPFLVKPRAVLLKLLSIFQSPGSLECRVLGEVWDSASVNTPPPSPSLSPPPLPGHSHRPGLLVTVHPMRTSSIHGADPIQIKIQIWL